MPLRRDSTPEEDEAYFLGLTICLLVILVLGVPITVAFFGGG